MPFVYFGGKKALARHYPPPAFPTIIEPFAGSAGYALHWATPSTRVVLIEKDPAIAALWRRLQAPDARDDLRSITCPPAGERCTEPLIALTSGGVGGNSAATKGQPFQVTTRMERDWKALGVNRVLTALPLIRRWEIIEGDYTEAPDVRATWFIDPPYWVPPDAAGSRGDGYRHGADAIDFDALGRWCQARRGQAIVCEQEGATWLPFRPLRAQMTAAGDGGKSMEVVWLRTPGNVTATPRARQARADAKERRAARARK